MRKLLLILPLFTALIFISCQKEQPILETNESIESFKQYANVDQQLWPYWESFENEARIRGIQIDLEQANLMGVFVEIDQEHVAGSCTFSSNQPRIIRIDNTIWNELPNLYREFIVFHELGHCVLLRNHDETEDQHGNCLSIMRSGINGCKDAYNAENRDFYLDELFNNF